MYAFIILTAWVFAACFAMLGSEDLSAWNGQIKDSAPFLCLSEIGISSGKTCLKCRYILEK
ncbi:MAG: hypothetical protein PUC50_17375 [Bacteroidales bacterium]|nr:hypothetical protein [Bacteroidales bacterium]